MKLIDFKSLLMLLALSLAAMLTSCDKTDDLDKESPEVKFIDASGDYAETLTFAYDATASQTIKIRANRAWTVDNRGSSWIEVNPSSGNANAQAQTIEIVMRSDNTGENARQADVTFRASSGRSAVLTVIQEANEENREYMSIAHLISLIGSNTEYTVTENFWVRGTVVNDPQLLNAGLADKSVYVVDQDGESGINFITVASGHGLTRGDIIAVQVTGLKLQFFNEALQADGLANDKFEKVSGGNPIPYKTATIEQLNGGAYQSMAVQIENVQFLLSQVGSAFINSTRNLEDIDGNILAVYTNSRATPLAGEVVPEGNGTMYGVVGRYGSTVQLYITATSDYAGLTGERFDSGDEFGELVTLPYTVDFDNTTDFVASQEYNRDYVVFFGPENRQWGTYFGTVSTTGYIEGGQSMQMRWYTSNSDKIGYTYTHFELENLSKVNFKALQTNGLKVVVSHSTDKGLTWSAGQEFTPATTAGDFTYDVSATGVNAAVRWMIVLPATAPTATSRLTIDNVEFLAPGQVSPPEFSVSETPRTIGSAGGNIDISVTGNVDWTSEITAGSEYVSSMTPTNGNGNGTISVGISPNTDTENARTITVKVSTTAVITPAEYFVTITQAAASGGGATPNVGDVIFSETWGTEGTSGDTSGLAVTSYAFSGTTTFDMNDVTNLNYTTSSGTVTYTKIYLGDSVAASSGYTGASGGTQILLPQTSRSENLVMQNIPLYGVAAIDMSFAHRGAAASITVTYTFNDAANTTGNFANIAISETGNDNWKLFSMDNVTVPAGATTLKLEFRNTTGSNVRSDDIIIRAAAN